MKSFGVAALVAAQILTSAQPVLAAEIAADQQVRAGVFGGVRVQIPFGGGPRDRQLRAGLALAPALRSERADGAVRTRLGEGLQFGLGESRRAELTFGGTRIDRLGLARNGRAPAGRRAGVSTLGWVGIGAGVVVVALAGAAFWLHEAIECGPGDDC